MLLLFKISENYFFDRLFIHTIKQFLSFYCLLLFCFKGVIMCMCFIIS